MGKAIIFSAPSGTGKSTLINWLMSEHPELCLHFSISCTNRTPRGTEKDGVEYYFLSTEEFQNKINNGDFLEYEEVYAGRYYGTLRSVVDTSLKSNKNLIFDIDVKGGCNIKKELGSKALSIFIKPPSIESLKERLTTRGTDTAEVIQHRINRAEYELSFEKEFDKVVINDELSKAKTEVLALIQEYLKA